MAEDAPSQIFRPGLLDGRVCVVSGAGTGLGRAIAIELAALGATVVGCGRRPEPLADVTQAIGEAGGVAEAEPIDIRDAEAVDRLFDGVIERHGRLDVLVNNAGGQFMSPAEAITAKGFRTVTELNVQGTWQMTHAAATKAFIPQRSGKVVSVTLSPHHGMPGMVHSGAARAAVENMMRTLSDRVGAVRHQAVRRRRRPVRHRGPTHEVPAAGRRARRIARSRWGAWEHPRRWPGWSPIWRRPPATSSRGA